MLSYNSDIKELDRRISELEKHQEQTFKELLKLEERMQLFLKRMDRLIIDTGSKGAMT
jgi:prefoldin subunit 5